MKLTQVLVSDPDARTRLRTVSALRGRFAVTTLDAGELLVRGARRLRPGIVLLSMPRARMMEALRLCHALKTEGSTPPRVALIDRWCRLSDPSSTLSSCDGDGYLGGKADDDAILTFLRAVESGGRPVTVLEPELGLLGRLIRTNHLR